MPSKTEDRFRTHVILEESHHETIKTLRHEIGSTSAIIRAALDAYLPVKIEEVHSKIANRKRQTLQAIQLQDQRSQVDNLESAYAKRSEDFRGL